jgi:CubicO group peptidase (beta-lactamase class C family)
MRTAALSAGRTPTDGQRDLNPASLTVTVSSVGAGASPSGLLCELGRRDTAVVSREKVELASRLFANVAPGFVVVRRAVAAGLVLAAVAAAPVGATTLDERLQAVADGVVSDVFVGAGLFGGQQAFYVPATAVTVDRPGRGPRTYVAGRADVRRGRVVRPGDPQPVGSGTKPMTALLVLELARRGRIGINDRLTDVAAVHRRDGGRLARLVARHQRRLRGITLRQLLNMSSGLRDYDDDPRFGRVFARSPRARRSMARLASFGLARPRLFRPGAPGRTYYSNTNYVLAGMVVEAVTGRSFASRLRALFRRAGMRRSSYPPGLGPGDVRGYQPPLPGQRELPAVVRPFLGLPDLSFSVTPRAVLSVSTGSQASGPTVAVRPAPDEVRARYGGTQQVVWQDVTGIYRPAAIGSAAGAAVSTTGDLARFWRLLFSGRLGDRATLRLMRSSVPAPPNPRGVRNYFALGMQRQDVARGACFPGSPAMRIWMKLGDIFGYTSASYYVQGPRPYGGAVVTNVTNLFPSPVGDLGVLRDTLRALRG